MYKSLKKISKKQWFKVSSLSTIAIGVKFFTSLVNSKIMAYFLGPSGIAFIENVRNVFTSIDALATVGITPGVTNDILKTKNSSPYFNSIFSTSFWFVFIWSFLVCMAIMFFLPSLLSLNKFSSISYYFLIGIFSLYPLVILQLIFQAYLNGFELYTNIVRANIITGILSIIINAILIYIFGVPGVLITMILLPIFLVFYYGNILKSKIDVYEVLKPKFFKLQLLKNYYKFSVITLLSGVLGPLIYLLVRNQIVSQLGWFDAGIWSALTRVSSFYLLIPSTLISCYFFPKILKSNSPKRAWVFIKKYLTLVIPLFLVVFVALYFSANFWIKIILTQDFLTMENYLKYQFLGDFFKIVSLIFGYYFVANKKILAFVVCEIISLGSFYLLSNFFIEEYALNGIVISYLVSILLYFLAVIFFFFLELKFSKSTF